MKKLLVILICALLCLSLIACGGECAHNDSDGDGKCDACGETVGTPPSNECTKHTDANKDGKCDVCGAATSTAPTEDKVELVKNGAAQFQVVMDAEVASKNMVLVKSAVDKINLRLESGAEMVAEAQSTEQTYEILVGSVASRGDAYTFDKHDYGYKGYIVKIIGSKICVVAGSDDALDDALDDMLKTFFGIKNNKVNPIDSLTLTAENSIDKTQNDYSVTELTVNGSDVDDFAIVVSVPTLNALAESVQTQLYYNIGYWLDIVSESELAEGQGAIRLNLIANKGEGTTDDGFHVYVEDGDVIIDCEFANKFEAAALSFLRTKIFNSANSTVAFTDGTVYTYNVRDIYYSEFNAKGDGFTDDFFAIKAAHDYANQYGHRVNANASKTYYIGNKNGSSSIVVKTDTNWNGCKFIFDDSGVSQTDSASRGTAIFHIDSDYSTVTYSGSSLPITSLDNGVSNIGFAPGYPALIIVYNANTRHYLRYGPNQNDGFDQQEIIYVDAEGNIDPNTPVQWTYETITKIEVLRADDKPITVSGGTRENRALVETIFNGAPVSQYTYYWRNIYVNRSNVILENIEHIITDDIPEVDGGTGAPYQGFTLVRRCANVIVRGMTYQHPEFRHVYNQANNRMGSYEMNASHVHNLMWTDCEQSNFFNADGSVTFHGMMGTNYCKNLTFDNVFVCSFDAHEGVYNATIKNSTCEHMNFIGDGLITIENVTIYVDGEQHAAMNLRDDYGSTWWGDIYIDGLNMKYASSLSTSYDIVLIRVVWYNHFFGYSTSLPQNITMKNVNMYEYDFGIDDYGKRWETIKSTNSRELYIYSKSIGNVDNDYSDPDLTIQEKANDNPYAPTKSITVVNTDPNNPLKITWMTNPMFKDTVITVDGKKIKN